MKTDAWPCCFTVNRAKGTGGCGCGQSAVLKGRLAVTSTTSRTKNYSMAFKKDILPFLSPMPLRAYLGAYLPELINLVKIPLTYLHLYLH